MDEGLFLLLPSDAKARDYFDQLFTATRWDLLVAETNRYAHQKYKPIEVTSIADMKAYEGIRGTDCSNVYAQILPYF